MEPILSTEELKLISDRNIFDLKASAREKIIDHLEKIKTKLKHTILKKNILCNRSGKISKGENYLKMPWQVLDYPAYFSGDDIMTIRTMIVWGYEVNCTMILKGDLFQRFLLNTDNHLAQLSGKQLLFCLDPDPWTHHYASDRFVHIDQERLQAIKEILRSRNFIKVSAFLPFSKINALQAFAEENIERYLQVLDAIGHS